MILAIDPGHGMSNRRRATYDPGALGGGITEAAIVLDWALTLHFLAAQAGIRTVLTRSDATQPAPLGERVRRATLGDATHLLSLHCNANQGTPGTGTEVLIPGGAYAPWGRAVLNAAIAALGLENRGVKERSDLAVLKFPGPCCLLELGFINNPSDREQLQSRDRRIRFAETLLRDLPH